MRIDLLEYKKRKDQLFIYQHQLVGLMIQMDFQFLMKNIICFINIIHMVQCGGQCIGGIVNQRYDKVATATSSYGTR